MLQDDKDEMTQKLARTLAGPIQDFQGNILDLAIDVCANSKKLVEFCIERGTELLQVSGRYPHHSTELCCRSWEVPLCSSTCLRPLSGWPREQRALSRTLAPTYRTWQPVAALRTTCSNQLLKRSRCCCNPNLTLTKPNPNPSLNLVQCR